MAKEKKLRLTYGEWIASGLYGKCTKGGRSLGARSGLGGGCRDGARLLVDVDKDGLDETCVQL